MNKLTKQLFITMLVIIFSLSVVALVACNELTQPKLDVTVADYVDIMVGDSLDDVKPYLTVKYTDSDGNELIVTDYELQGALTEGEATLTVKYNELTTTCTITVRPYELGEPSVIVEAYGGDMYGEFTINDDGTLTPPEHNPSKSGYEFDGWYKDKDCNTEWNFATDKVRGATTVYARWSIYLLMWAPNEEKEFYQEWAAKWAKNYKDSQGQRYTVEVSNMNESDAIYIVTKDIDRAADIFCFTDDQLKKAVYANALSEVGAPTQGVAKQIADRNIAYTVEEATCNGKLYAYPMQGYCSLLCYNSDILTANDVKSWQGIFSKVAEINANKPDANRVKVQWNGNSYDAWFQSSLFFAFDGTVSATDTNFDTEVGIKALKASHWLSSQPDIVMQDLYLLSTQLNNGTIAAGVGNTQAFKYSVMNDNINFTVLPSITVDGDTKPMKSFMGSVLMGVNSHRMFTEACHAFANYLTDEAVQTAKITALSSIPSNLNSLQSNEAKYSSVITAFVKQMENGVSQANLPSGFWSGMLYCLREMSATEDGNISAYYNAATGEYNTEEMQKLLDKLREEFFSDY